MRFICKLRVNYYYKSYISLSSITKCVIKPKGLTHNNLNLRSNFSPNQEFSKDIFITKRFPQVFDRISKKQQKNRHFAIQSNLKTI